MKQAAIGGLAGVVGIAVIGGLMWGLPKYNVYRRELSGMSQLKEAEWNRKIAIQEAEARLGSSKLDAQAEIERAKGVAEAIMDRSSDKIKELANRFLNHQLLFIKDDETIELVKQQIDNK